MGSGSRRKSWKKLFFFVIFCLALPPALPIGEALAVPQYGMAPANGVDSNQAPSGGAELPAAPNGAVPSYNGPGFNGPNPAPSSNGSPAPPTSSGATSGGAPAPSGTQGAAPGSSSSAASSPPAPTFMDSAMPNSANPFLPSVVSPGVVSSPIENSFLQAGVPQIAAPLMSAVYRPFGLTYFQPNPFQVTPQGSVSLTGAFGEETNVNFSPTQPEAGGYYMIMPAVMYSTFDDYGYLSPR